MFGGSTTFGYGQRDDHTIASSLVAIAERNGIALDVVNFGVPGYGVWQEFLRFEDGLARADVPPDLVVFLDGHNDLLIQYQIDARGGDPTRPATQVDDRLQELIARKPPTTDTSSPAGPETIGQQTVDRWERTWRLITELSSVHDTTAIAFWQPMLVTKVPKTGAEEGLIKPSDAENLGRSARSARTEIPEGVIDLSDSLNRDETLFYDSVHTNERGAALVAEAMWPEIQRQLATR